MERRGDGLEGLSTALVLASPLNPGAEAVCVGHLTAGAEPPKRVLSVVFTGRPDQRVERWERHAGALPETFVVLSTQRSERSAEGAEVVMLDRPGDLTDIGVAITEHIAEWPDDGRGVFCLDSLTAQLQYVDTKQVYQFLHTLRGHLADRGVVGHVHMNPAAHDQETVETFETLFEAVVEVGEDGHTVRARQ